MVSKYLKSGPLTTQAVFVLQTCRNPRDSAEAMTIFSGENVLDRKKRRKDCEPVSSHTCDFRHENDKRDGGIEAGDGSYQFPGSPVVIALWKNGEGALVCVGGCTVGSVTTASSSLTLIMDGVLVNWTGTGTSTGWTEQTGIGRPSGRKCWGKSSSSAGGLYP